MALRCYCCNTIVVPYRLATLVAWPLILVLKVALMHLSA
jgi:hypothetical protein